MNGKGLLAVAAMGLAIGGSAQGEMIVGTYDFQQMAFSPAGVPDFLSNYGIGVFRNGGFQPADQFLVTDGLIDIYPTDVGTSWTSDAATSASIIEQFQDGDLTDGIGLVQMVGPFTTVATLSESFFGAEGLDLAAIASQMDVLRVTLASYIIEPPDPNRTGTFPGPEDWFYDVTFRFDFISVPAPSAAAPLLIGGAFAARRRRSRA